MYILDSSIYQVMCFANIFSQPVAFNFLSNVFHLVSEVKVAQLCPTLCDPWTIESMEFSRPEYWSG